MDIRQSDETIKPMSMWRKIISIGLILATLYIMIGRDAKELREDNVHAQEYLAKLLPTEIWTKLKEKEKACFFAYDARLFVRCDGIPPNESGIKSPGLWHAISWVAIQPGIMFRVAQDTIGLLGIPIIIVAFLWAGTRDKGYGWMLLTSYVAALVVCYVGLLAIFAVLYVATILFGRVLGTMFTAGGTCTTLALWLLPKEVAEKVHRMWMIWKA